MQLLFVQGIIALPLSFTCLPKGKNTKENNVKNKQFKSVHIIFRRLLVVH